MLKVRLLMRGYVILLLWRPVYIVPKLVRKQQAQVTQFFAVKSMTGEFIVTGVLTFDFVSASFPQALT